MNSPTIAHQSIHRPFARPAQRPTGRGLRALALAAICLPALTSCVSEAQMRLAVEERDRMISSLRTDKATLQERIDLLQFEKEDLRAQLASASSRMPSGPEPAAFSSSVPSLVDFPELEDLGITTKQRAGETVISVPAEVTFASGKASVSDPGRSALMKVAARLKSDFSESSRFYIEGHTDSDPIRKSSFGSNRELSIERAMAVLDFLVTEGRVPDRRFVVVGHGQYSPIAANDASNKAKNRRVEIVVKKGV